MKTKFWIIGSFIAVLCLFTACGDDNEDGTVKSIAVTPATLSPLEVGSTVELTAVITPSDATEAIKWVSDDPATVSVTGVGAKATITAVKPGTTNVFATNQAGIVASNKIAVTVNPVDYAGPTLGNYTGTGTLTGAVPQGMGNPPISGVKITAKRVGDAKDTVELTLIATVAGMGDLQFDAPKVVVSAGTGGKLTLSGETDKVVALGGLWFAITGDFDPVAKTLALVLVDGDDGAAKIKVDVAATKAN
jgi:hypothetical protein